MSEPRTTQVDAAAGAAGTRDARVPDEHGMSHAVEGDHGSTADHGDDHGHDDHAHAGGTLGPIDWTMWAIGVLGVIVALIITAGLAAATGFAFNA
jgi:ABC-type Zn2+ transport system substrate-binding protein/surface adhesin